MVYCSAFGCNNKPELKIPGITFHRFPKNLERRQLWIDAVKRKDWLPSSTSVLCSVHFKEEFFDRTSLAIVRLREGAVPSIFPAFPSYLQPKEKEPRDKKRKICPESEETHYGNSSVELSEQSSSRIPALEISSEPRVKNEEENCPKQEEKPPTSSLPVFETPIKSALRNQLNRKCRIINRQSKKIKRLQQRTRRMTKRVTNLKNVISDLKTKFNLENESCSLLENISETSLFLVKRQIKKSKGHQLEKIYNEKLRAFALTLNYISPRAYDYVRNVFDTCLPHRKTISNWYKTVQAEPGFCDEAFKALNLFTMSKNYPVVTSLIIDSMSIKKCVEWDGKRYFGYVNYGFDYNDDSAPIAKEALVFLVNAINGCWKLPVAYFFVEGTSGQQLSDLVLNCIKSLHEVGVIIASLTFDGAAANLSMAVQLGCSLDPTAYKTYFAHPITGDAIYIFLDPCHMIKLVRNTLGDRIIKYGDRSISWEYVKKLYSLQQSEGLHLANKLTKGHINWQDQKMKVKLAAQTISESVAIAIDYCRVNNIAGFSKSEETSHFFTLFNNLFDVLNSHSNKGYGFKKALNESNYSSTKSFLMTMFSYIGNLKDLKGNLMINTNRKVGFIGFQICILSAIGLFEELVVRTNFLKYLPFYKISQDHIELLFGKIRASGGWNNNPTAKQFSVAIKKLIVSTELSEIESGNCVPLERVCILTTSSLAVSGPNPINDPVFSINSTMDRSRALSDNFVYPDLVDHNYVAIPENIILTNISQEIVRYISGFVARHLSNKILCPDCASALVAKIGVDSSLIHMKTKGGLIHPSDDVVQVCILAEKYFRANFIIRGDHGRLVPTTTKLNVALATHQIINIILNKKCFSDLSSHLMNQEYENNHLVHLLKSICYKYFDVRLHYAAKNVSDILHEKKRRQALTKSILFQGL